MAPAVLTARRPCLDADLNPQPKGSPPSYLYWITARGNGQRTASRYSPPPRSNDLWTGSGLLSLPRFMTMLKAGLGNNHNTRRVRVSKLADSRVGVGLANGPGRTICVAEVFASSPLEGHIWPGDIIRGVSGTNVRRLRQTHPMATRIATH